MMSEQSPTETERHSPEPYRPIAPTLRYDTDSIPTTVTALLTQWPTQLGDTVITVDPVQCDGMSHGEVTFDLEKTIDTVLDGIITLHRVAAMSHLQHGSDIATEISRHDKATYPPVNRRGAVRTCLRHLTQLYPQWLRQTGEEQPDADSRPWTVSDAIEPRITVRCALGDIIRAEAVPGQITTTAESHFRLIAVILAYCLQAVTTRFYRMQGEYPRA